jgi:hypothetical protein
MPKDSVWKGAVVEGTVLLAIICPVQAQRILLGLGLLVRGALEEEPTTLGQEHCSIGQLFTPAVSGRVLVSAFLRFPSCSISLQASANLLVWNATLAALQAGTPLCPPCLQSWAVSPHPSPGSLRSCCMPSMF